MKTESITIRLTPGQKEVWKKEAEKLGISVSALVAFAMAKLMEEAPRCK